MSLKGPVLDPWMLAAGSVHGTNDYMRWVGRSQEERSEQRKAARLCLDTSAHAGTEFQRLMTVLSSVSDTLHVVSAPEIIVLEIGTLHLVALFQTVRTL